MTEKKNPADMGGEPAGPIDTTEHELAFGNGADAIGQLLRPWGQFNKYHEGRRAIEALGEEHENSHIMNANRGVCRLTY